MHASIARANGLSVQGGASVLCPCTCHSWGHPLAGLLQWQGHQGCKPVPAGRKERQAEFHSVEPWSCVASQGNGAPQAPARSQPSGLSALGQFCPPVLSPDQQALCNLCPISSLFDFGKSFRVPVFLLPQSDQLWVPILHKQLESESFQVFHLS